MKKIFTLMALACMALTAQAQGKYALEAGTGDFAAGTQVTTVPNIKLTFGYAGEADYKNPTADAAVEGYTAYTAGNGVNGKADGASGTTYILEPAKDGEITVAVVINADKKFYVIEDGTALSDYNGITEAEKSYKTYKFNVSGGKTYKVTCAGSKLGFYGFEYTVSENNQGGGDTPVVPTNSEVYSAIVDGKLAPEFAAIAGEGGGAANNVADGKSIITIQAGKATVTAVGGTTPANDTEIGGGAQQIVPGTPIEGKENTYEVAEVKAWNEVNWGLKNQGDIDFWYVTGTGNPYVDMLCVQNSKDGDLVEGSYKADYVYYEPDGSVGLPITGLYYKFTASAQGAFKVKVWANKGNRKTFVVNSNTKQAERLYASGYINGVNDEGGQKKLLTVEQVDSVHHVYIWGSYEDAVAKGKAEDQTQEDFDAKIAELKAQCEANEIDRQYVIGNGNQNFWGWLTFDVEPGEEYWVFQHSSQIGFGGFEFHEGITAEELINGIEAAYVYTTNFSTYENEEGERVTWKGEKAIGEGKFTSEEPELDEEGKPINIVPFGDYYQNVAGTAPRQNYCLLPEDVLAHSAKTHQLTIAFWVSAQGFTPDQYTYAPLFTAYAQQNAANTWPMLALQSRGLAQLNCSGWCDFTAANNVSGKNNIYNTNAWEAGDAAFNAAGNWLEDQKWHYYTAVFTDTNLKIFLDGEVKNEWNVDGTTDGQVISGLFTNGADLKYVCLGGNQAWDWGDLDSPFRFARLLIKNSAMSAGEVKAQMLADFPEYEAYQAAQPEPEPEPEPVGITAVSSTVSPAAVYSLSGQKVGAAYKGLVIKNGVKSLQK